VRDSIDLVFADSRIRQAFRFISDNESEIEADQIRLTEIPAPPFGETARAKVFADELSRLHLRPITDSIGNVVAGYERIGRNPVIVAAHLDTVFPAATSLQLRRRGRMLLLPGISDNSAGIVALLWALRAAKQYELHFQRPVMAVGTVGEEGEGNLRGVRQLFKDVTWGERQCEFIAVDGGGLQRITHQALGSRRLRIRMTGPGGHSWADFGRPNPVQAIAAVIHIFSTQPPVKRPSTSFNFGLIRGGISVNAIPREAIAEIDLRSTAPAHIDELDNHLRRAAAEATRLCGVECKIDVIGERPSGTTAETASIVQTALQVTRRFGVDPQLDVGSTDANIPISMGIPAIAIGGGGTAGNVHTPDEWFDPSLRDFGIQRLLALIAVLAGLD
jgi:tripeptide aminopeptidase